jgi:hypothetical protein
METGCTCSFKYTETYTPIWSSVFLFGRLRNCRKEITPSTATRSYFNGSRFARTADEAMHWSAPESVVLLSLLCCSSLAVSSFDSTIVRNFRVFDFKSFVIFAPVQSFRCLLGKQSCYKPFNTNSRVKGSLCILSRGGTRFSFGVPTIDPSSRVSLEELSAVSKPRWNTSPDVPSLSA